MRLIFSRKGFDSATGGAPSPILPDRRLLSLPIPRAREGLRYGDVRFGDGSLGPVVEDLTGGRLGRDDRCHLDPDLRPGARQRTEGWRPLFGQSGAAASHLTNQGVEAGDLFLFFGWFRRARLVDGALEFAPGAPDLHVLFGWLQVGAVHPRPARRRDELPRWMHDHPHTDPDWPRPGNLLFSAAPELTVDGSSTGLPGGGAFERLSDGVVLTAEGESRSVWELPRSLWRDDPDERLTYHRRRDRWHLGEETARLRTVGQGQEFVIDLRRSGELDWLLELFDRAA